MADRRVEHFRTQAEACLALGSPFYAVLIGRLTEDLEAGGPTRDVLHGHESDSGPSALALRLTGAIHRLVLEGKAPALASYYPSVGGTADAQAAWPELRQLLVTHRTRLNRLLDQPPQTNEVGRSTALLGGLLHVAREFGLSIRLCEIGSSGGPNLRADRYRYVAGASSLGPVDSPLEVARTVPAAVRREDAVTTAHGLELVDGRVTVLWHSVMWQYLRRDERTAVGERLDALGASATIRAPLARLSLEPERRTPESEHEFLLTLRTWPGGRRILGTAAPHGVPTTWE